MTTVPGLTYVEEYVSDAEERALMDAIDAAPWLLDLKRRTQHYGYRYDYRARAVTPDLYLGPLPDWAQQIALRLATEGYMLEAPEQLIVNEYEPGQGITSHTDSPAFGPVIASLSLGSPCVMLFDRPDTGQQAELLLQPRSLLVLAGEARSLWRHGIPKRQTDRIAGLTVRRSRRLSLTYRTVPAQSLFGRK